MIARNILATHIALTAKKIGVVRKICLDGRGAIAAEWNEYQVVPDKSMRNAIHGQEKEAVLKSDYRIAVSGKLVDYWRDSFDYIKNDHVVIPCTLTEEFMNARFSDEEIRSMRTAEGFTESDIVMVYSGSTAGWQSLGILEELLGNVLKSGTHFKLLFLSKEDKTITSLKNKFPGQVFNKWVSFDEVKKVLSACDYGILYRESSVTNKVASPTKFAEYLSSGLPVVISENLGDYTDFVRKEKCGFIISDTNHLKLHKPLREEKLTAINLAKKYFTKEANKVSYNTLINFLKNN